MVRLLLPGCLLLALAATCASAQPLPSPDWKGSGPNGAVAAGGQEAVDAGISVLKSGGNAADAAAATILALSVTDSNSFCFGRGGPLRTGSGAALGHARTLRQKWWHSWEGNRGSGRARCTGCLPYRFGPLRHPNVRGGRGPDRAPVGSQRQGVARRSSQDHSPPHRGGKSIAAGPEPGLALGRRLLLPRSHCPRDGRMEPSQRRSPSLQRLGHARDSRGGAGLGRLPGLRRLQMRCLDTRTVPVANTASPRRV